jgi:hypothetical protein
VPKKTIKLKISKILIVRFELQFQKFKNLCPRQSTHNYATNLKHFIIIIIYKHCLPKKKELKNQVLKLRFKIQLITLQFVLESDQGIQ